MRTSIRKGPRADQQNVISNYKLGSKKKETGFSIQTKTIFRSDKNVYSNDFKNKDEKSVSKSHDFKMTNSQGNIKNTNPAEKTGFVIKSRNENTSAREQSRIKGISIFDRKNSDKKYNRVSDKFSRVNSKQDEKPDSNSANINHIQNKNNTKGGISINSLSTSKNFINYSINNKQLINNLKKSTRFEKDKNADTAKVLFSDINIGKKESENNDNKKRIMFNQSMDFTLNNENKIMIKGKIDSLNPNKNLLDEDKNTKKIPLKSNRNALGPNSNRDSNFFSPLGKNEASTKKPKTQRLPMLSGFVTQVPAGSNLVTESLDIKKKVDDAFDNNEKPILKKKIAGSTNKNSDYAIVKQNLLTSAYGYYLTGVHMFYKSSDRNYFANLYKDHFKHTFTSLQFCKNLKSPSKRDLVMRKMILNRKAEDKNKKTLVLDLDETLIHCNTTGMGRTDVILPILFPSGEKLDAAINIRPGCQDFLREMSKLYEIVVFTASHGCYANVVLDHLDPNREWVSHRLFREKCLLSESGVYIKD